MVSLSLLNLVIAYLAGFLTFFAGCLAPVAPVYVSYLAGVAPDKVGKKEKKVFLRNAIFFTFGFLLVFLILGLSFNSLARVLVKFKSLIEKIAGLFLVVFGLSLGNFIRIPFLERTFSFKVNAKEVGALGLGITFGLSWTPCIGPVLAAILFWTSSRASLYEGLVLLILFALGLGTPFVLIGLAFEKVWPVVKRLGRYSVLLNKLAGIILIIFGILVFTNKFGIISSFLLEKLGSMAFSLEFKQ